MGVIETPLTDSLASFQAPTYIPGSYMSASNNSTNYDKAFYFKDNETNQFMVGAIKDTNQSQLTELQNPLKQDNRVAINQNITITDQNITVSGHQVVFQTLKMDFMGLTMNIFHASWTCNQTGLQIVVMGKMKDNETEEMKKMATSITCHHEKKGWRLF